MMPRSLPCLLLLFTIGLSIQPLRAQGNSAITIPFMLEQNCIFIYGKVNDTDSLKFLFDTGADGSVITFNASQRVNLRTDGTGINVGANGQNQVQITNNNRLAIGSIQFDPMSFTIIEYGDVHFDGVLGTDVMQQHVIEIDYGRQVLVFYPHNSNNINYNGYRKEKICSGIYPTYIKAKFVAQGKAHKGYFGIDTGADDALTLSSPFSQKHDLASKLVIIGEAASLGSDGNVSVQPIVLSEDLVVGGMHFYRVPVSLSNATEGIDASKELMGFYGNNFLKRFNLLLDYKKGYIYFKLNHHLYSPYFD
jgi:hypothetical protein